MDSAIVAIYVINHCLFSYLIYMSDIDFSSCPCTECCRNFFSVLSFSLFLYHLHLLIHACCEFWMEDGDVWCFVVLTQASSKKMLQFFFALCTDCETLNTSSSMLHQMILLMSADRQWEFCINGWCEKHFVKLWHDNKKKNNLVNWMPLSTELGSRTPVSIFSKIFLAVVRNASSTPSPVFAEVSM